jgi:hypothetical protein
MQMRCAVALASAVAVSVACSTSVERISEDQAGHGLAFLHGARVPRHEVEARIGAPVATYENGRITTFRLTRTESGYAPGPMDARITLVVIYGPDDAVERWGLVDRKHEK